MSLTSLTKCVRAVAVYIETLYQKLQGRGFTTRRGHWILFNVPNPCSLSMAMEFDSVSLLPGGRGQSAGARKDENLTATCEQIL
jgi:hypothetical protein